MAIMDLEQMIKEAIPSDRGEAMASIIGSMKATEEHLRDTIKSLERRIAIKDEYIAGLEKIMEGK